jgi:hypothetical protein
VKHFLDMFAGWLGESFQGRPWFKLAVMVDGLILINWFVIKKWLW